MTRKIAITKLALLAPLAFFAWQATAATVAYYRFEDGANPATDETGNFSGTLVGPPTYDAAVGPGTIPLTGAANTQSMLFTAQVGSGDIVTASADLEVGAGDFTLEAFFRVNDTFDPALEHLVGKPSPTSPARGDGNCMSIGPAGPIRDW